jgi:serine/threonine protein kinase
MSSTPFVAPTLEALAGLLPAYEFQAFIAQGGMGAVYKARQRSLDRDVAIKILPRELGEDPDFRKSFETEARAMARLNHPNLIGVYDSGDVDGMLYIAMEYVNGKSLYYSAYNLAVDPTQAATIVKGICEGLAHAHENGVIHRDIKPANILLTPKREPKIGDFGLARPSGTEGPGLIMGTPGYTAPEVLDRPDHADRRSDIYAVGVILYELLTGRKQEDGCPVPSAVGGCDPALDAIWKSATHPDPAARYGDASLMAKALDEWLNKPAAGKQAAAAPRKLVAAAAAVPAKRALAVPAAKAAAGAPAADSPAVPPPQVAIGGNNWGLVRNLVIIAVLLVTIAGTWKVYQRTKTTREENNRIAIEQEAAKRAKAAAEARMALANPAPAPKPVTPEPAPVAPEPPKPETGMEGLARLQRDLVAGKRDEMPPGTIRRGDSDFLLVPTAMPWQQAAAFAEAHGGHLPQPNAEEDLTWLSSRVPDEPADGNKDTALWVGAGRSGRSAWSLVDGSPWKLKAPAGTGLFLAVDDLGLIRVRKPEDRYPFFIQWRRDGSNPADLATVLKRTRESLALPIPLFPPGTVAYEARHVLVLMREVTAAKAAELAELGGATLMVPASRDEAGWLTDQLGPLAADRGLWLGGFREDSEWKWITGETWSFANWEEGYPTSDGDGLVIYPGKGWRNADASDTASGFILEWSNDRETAAAAPAETRKTALPGDLAAKSKQLLATLQQERQRDLAANSKNLAANLDTWLRRQNQSEKARWTPEVANLKARIVADRVPEGIDPSSGIRLSAEMAEFCADSAAKQKTIDATFNLKATKIRDAYLVRLKEARDDAQTRGQTEIAKALTDEAEAAGDLVAWLEQMGVEAMAAPTPDEQEAPAVAKDFKASDSDFVGRWQLGDNRWLVWEARDDGTVVEGNRRERQGTWEEVGGGVEITWDRGDKLRLKKRGARYVGDDERGREIVLNRAD